MSKQEKVKIVAYQGAPGANSHTACLRMFPECETLPCESFEQAFDQVRNGTASHAMIAVDNTIAGRVADVHHLMPGCGLFIVGEYFMRINFHLLGLPGSKLSDIRTVHSHVHALGQTRKFLKKHQLAARVCADTAGAAADIKEIGDPSQGAISPKLAAEIYGLDVLASDIEDAEHNTTRFIILAKEATKPPNDGTPVITSFLFRIGNVPAALYKTMGGFATNGVNMIKLESYIDHGFNQAQFFAEVLGHPDDVAVKNAMHELDYFATEVEFFGTFPASRFRAYSSQIPAK